MVEKFIDQPNGGKNSCAEPNNKIEPERSKSVNPNIAKITVVNTLVKYKYGYNAFKLAKISNINYLIFDFYWNFSTKISEHIFKTY